MLCGLNYWDVFKPSYSGIDVRGLAETKGFTRKQLLKVLKHCAVYHGVPLRIIIEYLCPRSNFHLEPKDFGIAKMPWPQGRNFHWVVWDGKFVYDPALEFGVLPYKFFTDQGERISSIIPMRYALPE